MTTLITKTNCRYITGTSKKTAGKIVSIRFRVFGASEAIVKAVTDRMKIKKTGIVGKLKDSKYNGWDLKGNLFFTEFITPDRATFQDSFKIAKRASIEASAKIEATQESTEKAVADAIKNDKTPKVIKKNDKK